MERVTTIIGRFSDQVINPILWLLVVAGVVYFFWQIVRMIYKYDDTTALEEGKRNLIWGTIGVAIMVSAIGLINFVKSFIDSFGRF